MEQEIIHQDIINYHLYLIRENGSTHHRFDDEQHLAKLLQVGDPKAADLCNYYFTSNNTEGVLSKDQLTDTKYRFACSVTLMTRYCIMGGLDENEAYYISDLFIQKLDDLDDIKSIENLNYNMVRYFADKMTHLGAVSKYSSNIQICTDYIYYHLHDKISVEDIADLVHLSVSHISRQFKKETGKSIADYISHKRLEAAANLLLYSSFSPSDIAFTLHFASQSYFIHVFKKEYNMTPKQYRLSKSKLKNL